jgi:hypothetical protein
VTSLNHLPNLSTFELRVVNVGCPFLVFFAHFEIGLIAGLLIALVLIGYSADLTACYVALTDCFD